MKPNLTVLVAAAVAVVACTSHRPAIVADDWSRALAESRRSSDGVLLVELWARW